jgi:hypothetical protein
MLCQEVSSYIIFTQALPALKKGTYTIINNEVCTIQKNEVWREKDGHCLSN